MSKLDVNSTVGQWVAHRLSLSRVFEGLGIDYCCGGKVPLVEACREKGLDLQDVLVQIAQATGGEAGLDGAGLLDASLAELCDHIESTHHAYLRSEFPRLTQMVEKVAAVHGLLHPETREVASTFIALRDELAQHMAKEEDEVFPLIRHLESSPDRSEKAGGNLAQRIAELEREHEVARDGLARLRQLTGGYKPPEGACNTFRAMLDGLHELESNMFQHVHKENSILFPRAIQLDAASSQAATRGSQTR